MYQINFGSAEARLVTRNEETQAWVNIYLDRDAMSTRGWLSRRGRRLLDGPGHLFSTTGGWLQRDRNLPKLLPPQGFAGQSC